MTSLNNVVMKLYTLTPIPTRCPNVAVFITNLLIDTKFPFLKCQWIFSLLARLVFFPISPTRRFSFLCHLQDGFLSYVTYKTVFFPISPTRRFSFLCHLQDGFLSYVTYKTVNLFMKLLIISC
jgi:hypothetical protein